MGGERRDVIGDSPENRRQATQSVFPAQAGIQCIDYVPPLSISPPMGREVFYAIFILRGAHVSEHE